MLFSFIGVLLLLSSIWPASSSSEVLEDLHESCGFWAREGECTNNPEYMLSHCRLSCVDAHEYVANDVTPQSFYDIEETLLDGNKISFNDFRNKVVYIVNVASQCGYTAENYATFRILSKYRKDGLEIVLAPCNSFGAQEPGDETAIQQFTKKNKFQGIILSKADVNGASTRPAFRYLKKETGKTHINW